MKRFERGIWLIAICLLLPLGGVLLASYTDTAPYILTNAAGTALHVLGTDGTIQNSGCKAVNPTSRWVFENSQGTALAGWAANGSILVTNTDNVSETAIAQSSGTEEVTATFAVAEADTHYQVTGCLEDSGTTTATVWVKRRNTTSIVFGAQNVNDSTTLFSWNKIRNQ